MEESEPTPDGRIGAEHPFLGIVERAYQVFQRPTPTDTESCECCWAKEIRDDFFNHGPRGLPYGYVTEWFSAAVSPPLPQGLWAWVLPRILECLASGETPSIVGMEVSLARFPTGNRERWSDEEWALLDEFQRSFVEAMPLKEQVYLDDYLCMFARAGWPAQELFEQVWEWPTERLVRQLHGDWGNWDRGGSVWVDNWWPDEAVSLAFWTQETLVDRFYGFSVEDGVSPELSAMAVQLAECIERRRAGGR